MTDTLNTGRAEEEENVQKKRWVGVKEWVKTLKLKLDIIYSLCYVILCSPVFYWCTLCNCGLGVWRSTTRDLSVTYEGGVFGAHAAVKVEDYCPAMHCTKEMVELHTEWTSSTTKCIKTLEKKHTVQLDLSGFADKHTFYLNIWQMNTHFDLKVIFSIRFHVCKTSQKPRQA